MCDPRSFASLGLSLSLCAMGCLVSCDAPFSPILPKLQVFRAGPRGWKRGSPSPRGSDPLSTLFTAPGTQSRGWAVSSATRGCVRSLGVAHGLGGSWQALRKLFFSRSSQSSRGEASSAQRGAVRAEWLAADRGLDCHRAHHCRAGWGGRAGGPQHQARGPSALEVASIGLPGCRSVESRAPTEVSQGGAEPRPRPRPS